MVRILTGLRANNDLHIGNYLGAMQPMVQRQKELGDKDSLFMFIPELHSFTTPIDHSKLYDSSLNNIRLYVAAGLDPENDKTVLYRQSRISAHSEMALILMNFTNFGEAYRMVEFKSKSGIYVGSKEDSELDRQEREEIVKKKIQLKNDIYTMYQKGLKGTRKKDNKLEREANSLFVEVAKRLDEEIKEDVAIINSPVKDTALVGLMTYPILMAADILLYDADYIPLGDDQKQHMELTRTLAERINNKFGEIFNVPKSWKEQLEFVHREKSVRVMSLSNPSNKMSKSVDDPKGTINLLDDPTDAKKKVMSAETDSVGKINYDVENQPGISNLLHIQALLTDTHLEDVVKKWEGQDSYGDLKSAVGESVEKFLSEFQSEYEKTDSDSVEAILEKGEAQASTIAEAKLGEVQKVLGLRC